MRGCYGEKVYSVSIPYLLALLDLRVRLGDDQLDESRLARAESFASHVDHVCEVEARRCECILEELAVVAAAVILDLLAQVLTVLGDVLGGRALELFVSGLG